MRLAFFPISRNFRFRNSMTTAKGHYDFDFAVAGGGPAGTSAAISLGQHGHSVVLFERDTFPRFHVGESLLPTANDAFAALGVSKEIDAACFPEKWGARLYTHDARSGRYVDFTKVREITRAQTYQVPRAQFDHILLKRAREVGVEIQEACNVSKCEFAADAATLDVASRVDGAMRRVRVRAIVDATGRSGLIARKFNLRTEEPRLANVAIYSHYKGIPRLEGARPDDIRLVARSDAGWFWLIPISKELMSVGVVLTKLLYRRLADGSPEETLSRAIADTPIVAEFMRDACREWPVRVEKDFSYSASTYAGHRWILAGDAGSFLDPVFSTGVSIAMESGIEAAVELHRALERNDFSAASFATFSRRQRRRFQSFRRFVVGFYTPQFRDVFFSPEPPDLIFRSVATILAGKWNPSLSTRFLNHLFFGLVSIQKHCNLTPLNFRRDPDAGYPT
jgi:flavin-dependent dehydrogenase